MTSARGGATEHGADWEKVGDSGTVESLIKVFIHCILSLTILARTNILDSKYIS